MKIRDLSISGDHRTITSNDDTSYSLNNLTPAEDFDELYKTLCDNDATDLQLLYDDAVCFKIHSTSYISPKDVGIRYSSDISLKAKEHNIVLNSRTAKDDSTVQLIDLDEDDDIIVNFDINSIDDSGDLFSGEYYFICKK